MRMYVANPTMFRVEFMYSIPESSKRLAQTIPPLTQVILAPNLTKEGVDSIVKQHGGQLRVDSEVGAGTTFHLLLPVPESYAAV